ncbi:hypothetical protein [Moraxella ovis]|uniref:hypothetical protein n=1 Tax=Moraxella ovis TaxID=29433 RepID=UPI0015EC4856|nr:hypothetical protein [Moraxella ovis]
MTNENMTKYPTKQVIISYLVLGGVVGSFLTLPFVMTLIGGVPSVILAKFFLPKS